MELRDLCLLFAGKGVVALSSDRVAGVRAPFTVGRRGSAGEGSKGA